MQITQHASFKLDAYLLKSMLSTADYERLIKERYRAALVELGEKVMAQLYLNKGKALTVSLAETRQEHLLTGELEVKLTVRLFEVETTVPVPVTPLSWEVADYFSAAIPAPITAKSVLKPEKKLEDVIPPQHKTARFYRAKKIKTEKQTYGETTEEKINDSAPTQPKADEGPTV